MDSLWLLIVVIVAGGYRGRGGCSRVGGCMGLVKV